MDDLALDLADELAARTQVRGRRNATEMREYAANIARVLNALERGPVIFCTRRPRPLPPDVEAMLASLRATLLRCSREERAKLGAPIAAALDRYRAGVATLAELVDTIAAARAHVTKKGAVDGCY